MHFCSDAEVGQHRWRGVDWPCINISLHPCHRGMGTSRAKAADTAKFSSVWPKFRQSDKPSSTFPERRSLQERGGNAAFHQRIVSVPIRRPCPSRNEVRQSRSVVTVRTMRPCASRYVTTSAAHRPIWMSKPLPALFGVRPVALKLSTRRLVHRRQLDIAP